MKNSFLWAIGAGILALIIFGVSKVVGSNEKLTRDYDALFIKYASKYGLNPLMLKAIALNESTLGKNKGYEPIGGTTGLMQIKLSTARDFFKNLTAIELENDEKQIETASAFLASLSKQFNGDERKTVMSYNQGAGNTRAGKEFAKPYWEKYLKHKQLIG